MNTINNLELKELTINYENEQHDIVIKRRAGYYKNKEDDIAAQKASWEKYIIGKYHATGNEKDAKEVFDYFQRQKIKEYLILRDKYYAGKIEQAEYIQKRNATVPAFENKLDDIGLLKNRMDDKTCSEHWEKMDAEIIKIKQDVSPLTSAEKSILCGTQMDQGTEFFNNFRELNDILL